MSEIKIIKCQGSELQSSLDELGKLRIAVFLEYPYLYEGDLEYERKYLKTYLQSNRSAVFLAFDKEKHQLIGASTCIPMEEEAEEFQAPFIKGGYDINRICYFGESILLPEYRGRGLGKEFFNLREAHARELGLNLTTFCAVDRPADHPRRPAKYRPLDEFWIARGYEKRPDLVAHFYWQEIGETQDSEHSLTFWTQSWQ